MPDKRANPPELGWWEFNIDDVTAGRGAAMMAITDATDADLSRYLLRQNGKLLMFHGWADPEGQAEPTLDYYRKVIETTFRGEVDGAREKVRLFMFPGMGHCGDGPGCHEADPLRNHVLLGVWPPLANSHTCFLVERQRRTSHHEEHGWPDLLCPARVELPRSDAEQLELEGALRKLPGELSPAGATALQ